MDEEGRVKKDYAQGRVDFLSILVEPEWIGVNIYNLPEEIARIVAKTIEEVLEKYFPLLIQEKIERVVIKFKPQEIINNWVRWDFILKRINAGE